MTSRPPSQAIVDFQSSCQKYFVCYSFSVNGLEDNALKLASITVDREKLLIVGAHPDTGHWHAKIKIQEAIDSSQQDSVFADKIAKSFITAMYSEWDEYYRHRLAEEVGVPAGTLKCDLMGDLRLIRHCIVHNKAIITDEQTRIKQLGWPLIPGSLSVTRDMLSLLIDQINRMTVTIAADEILPVI